MFVKIGHIKFKKIFDSINMQQVYITKSVCNIVTFENKCKELDEYLRTYIEYKQTFGTEEYVKYC